MDRHQLLVPVEPQSYRQAQRCIITLDRVSINAHLIPSRLPASTLQHPMGIRLRRKYGRRKDSGLGQAGVMARGLGREWRVPFLVPLSSRHLHCGAIYRGKDTGIIYALSLLGEFAICNPTNALSSYLILTDIRWDKNVCVRSGVRVRLCKLKVGRTREN